MCSHHAGLMASHSPDEVFRAIRNSSSAKEKARWAAKQYLKLDKEHPGVAWRTDPDGGIAIDLTQFNLPANKIAALRALIEQEAGTIEQVVGISQIRLEA